MRVVGTFLRLLLCRSSMSRAARLIQAGAPSQDLCETHAQLTLTASDIAAKLNVPPSKFSRSSVAMRVLLVDGDASLAESLYRQLTQEHFVVDCAVSTDQVRRLLSSEPYDCVVLDHSMLVSAPREGLGRIKAAQPNLAVLMTTSSSFAEDRVRALDAGADDCLTKPFVCAELAARIRAVLRRVHGSVTNGVLTVGDLVLDRVSHTVERRGRSVNLSPREFALLEFF
jgi:DNA-binding response OmpR family regulator